MSFITLFIVTIISFASGEIGRIDFRNGVAIHISDILLFITFLFWLLRIKKNFKVFYFFLTKPLILFVLFCIVSLLLNPLSLSLTSLFLSSLYLIRWILYCSILFISRTFTLEERKKIFQTLLITGLSLVLFGYIQYFFYPNLRNLYYLGWDDHLYRLFSTLLDPNFTATILSFLLFMLLTLLISSKKRRLLYLICFIISFIALLLTYSRSGYVMFIVGSVINLWLLRKRKLIFLLFVVLMFGIVVLPKDLGSAGVELWRTQSIIARSMDAQQAITIFLDNPILGVGFNTYRYAQKEYGFSNHRNWQVSHSDAGTDNSWLFVLVTTGVVGFILYILLWWRIIYMTYRVYKTNKSDSFEKTVAIILLSSIAGLFINAFFINSLFYPMVMLWMWVLIGLWD